MNFIFCVNEFIFALNEIKTDNSVKIGIHI